jgi:hypothetical protein
MGQYYLPIILKDKVSKDDSEQVLAFMYSHEYGGNGSKLMEHSWIGNPFVETFENLLSPRGKFKKMRVVWAGDYADGEPELTHTDDKGREVEVNLFGLCDKETNKIKPRTVKETKYRFIFNHDTKEFVDKDKCPVNEVYKDREGKEWPFTIHPLPLLTCEGCFRGGGDFHNESNTFVGKWARNRISVGNKILKGFTEIIPNFVEK